ncbi:hypothetical protein T492DRAFT_847944 [Pavlovales sp. CCMP2436]|nr:hypothetical protein T492DRAFT_847944 [Pavlovales sp. CCMP2436]
MAPNFGMMQIALVALVWPRRSRHLAPAAAATLARRLAVHSLAPRAARARVHLAEKDPAYENPLLALDPDVTLTGVWAYASGVSRLFDQRSARAEIARVRVRDADSAIEVAQRLSSGVTIGPLELDLKPYLVLTDLVVDQSGLVVYQEDTFSIPGWDILLSALFPALRPLLAPEAPPIAELRARLAAES